MKTPLALRPQHQWPSHRPPAFLASRRHLEPSRRWAHSGVSDPPEEDRQLTVLGLESSADDTCAAVVRYRWPDREILSNVVKKQHETHEIFGGIHPYHAVTKHQENMPGAIRQALSDARIQATDLDAIAFTRGPGMSSCLSVCSLAGKSLASALNIPVVGVHHMQAHALTPFLTEPDPPRFPFLTLLVSGGHTLLLLARASDRFKILATTTDDSIGDAYDKVSSMLQIPWSLGDGSPGKALEYFISSSPTSTPTSVPPANSPTVVPDFPISLRGKLEFSYSGLKQAVKYYLQSQCPPPPPPPPTHQADDVASKGPGRVNDEFDLKSISEEHRREVGRKFQVAAVAQLEDKVKLGLKWWEEEGRIEHGEGGDRGDEGRLDSLVISGGVASNLYLRSRLRAQLDKLGYTDMRLIFPPLHLCTDNAAMIAWTGIDRILRGKVDTLDTAHASSWSIEDCEGEPEVRVGPVSEGRARKGRKGRSRKSDGV